MSTWVMPMSDDHERDYTRVRFNLQRGDGPDQRGDVTIEVSRSTEEATREEVREAAEREASKATAHLELLLGLDTEEEESDAE